MGPPNNNKAIVDLGAKTYARCGPACISRRAHRQESAQSSRIQKFYKKYQLHFFYFEEEFFLWKEDNAVCVCLSDKPDLSPLSSLDLVPSTLVHIP